MRILIFCVAALLSFSVVGQEVCSDDPFMGETYRDSAFKEMVDLSKEISRELCLLVHEGKPDKIKLANLTKLWVATASSGLEDMKSFGIDLSAGVEELGASFLRGTPGAVHANSSPRKIWQISYEDQAGANQTIAGAVADDLDAKCQPTDVYGKNCIEVLKDFQELVSIVNGYKNFADLNKALAASKLYTAAWDKYFEESRSLTPWELILNTALYEDELKKEHFVLPPNYQWFLLHPSIVIENVSDAIDGQQEKSALSLEWVGFNRWNAKVPVGLSLVSVYADREGIEDVRHGVMLHLYNSYSIGYTGLGEDEKGFFVNIDLLKLVSDKESKLKSYKEKIYN